MGGDCSARSDSSFWGRHEMNDFLQETKCRPERARCLDVRGHAWTCVFEWVRFMIRCGECEDAAQANGG